jgi:adenosylhomocysteine nucleosidase
MGVFYPIKQAEDAMASCPKDILSSSGGCKIEGMETIGLIAAMPQESGALLRCVEGWERTVLGSFRCYRFRLSDRDCLLVTSGIGMKRAMDATRALLAATRPQFLVSFGVAGAVDDDLHIGDVVIASHVCLLEKGVPGRLQRLAPLSDAAWQAAARALQPRGAHLVSGTAITTRGSQAVRLPSEEMPHPVLEMETAGIAQVAAGQGIPLLSLRSVSDGPQAPIPFDLEAMTDSEYNYRIGRMIRAVLRRPQIILQSLRLVRNVRMAAENAAIALVAALTQPLPVVSP